MTFSNGIGLIVLRLIHTHIRVAPVPYPLSDSVLVKKDIVAAKFNRSIHTRSASHRILENTVRRLTGLNALVEFGSNDIFPIDTEVQRIRHGSNTDVCKWAFISMLLKQNNIMRGTLNSCVAYI